MDRLKSATAGDANGAGPIKRRLRREKLPLHERATLTVEEAALYLGIGRQTAYDEVRRGALPVVRMGRGKKRILVVRVVLDEVIQRRAREGSIFRPDEQTKPQSG